MGSPREWTTKDIDEILDDLRPITIPVNVSVEGRQKVMGFEESERLLRKARADLTRGVLVPRRG